MNQIFNENNMVTMSRMESNSISGVITSPPYNISSKRKDMYYNTGYSDIDNLTTDEYLEVRTNEFKEFDRIIKNDGVILYNMSYIHENPSLPHLLINKVISETNLTLADVIYWKKGNSIPFQTSPTKLSRIVEPVYVFVHKDSLTNFKTNKKVSKINPKTGQKFY
jgi:DNA modification methylase